MLPWRSSKNTAAKIRQPDRIRQRSAFFSLQVRKDKKYISVDSVISTDGSFEFAGIAEIPDVYYIAVANARTKAMFLLENSDITLIAHVDILWLPSGISPRISRRMIRMGTLSACLLSGATTC